MSVTRAAGRVLAAACLFSGAEALAETYPAPVWSGHVENDWIDDTDQDYTSAVKATRTARIAPSRWPARLMGAEDGDKSYLQLGFGQQLYTPRDKFFTTPLFGQHPYAAWLYGESAVAVDRGEGRPIDQLRVQLGVVGPWAQGERAQDFVHSIIAGTDFRGWENQIGNQPGLLVNLDRRWTALKAEFGGGWETDLVPHLGASLGNVLISANAGAQVRFGYNLERPLGIPRNEPGAAGIAWHEPGSGWGREAYVFAGVEGRAVAHQIWIDGRPFQDDVVTQDSEPLVYDLEVGFVMPFPFLDARMTASYVRRSETFKLQPEPRGFGTLSVSTRF